ncbi:probable disease resistance protein RF45 [Raphanus sativus]|uniref:Probable disease resistance protein RF45 n=1 Tax=Raphanus sativus TaxID=3726 RepID=A0A9W3BUX7_RAPSA|nr:probable disease resistance protein RF45 [Raphanus sativus]
MNHNCHLANLQMVKEEIGLDAWESIKTSFVGVILKLKELNYTWSAKAVHHLLTNQLVVNNIHEIWSAIEGQAIRFSLYEFGDITSLNCEPFNINEEVEIDHKPFWEKLGVSPSHGHMLSELRLLFTKVRNWTFEERRMFGLLCVLSVGVLGISPGSRIPLDQAKRVLDIEAFDRYPWGRVGFSSLKGDYDIETCQLHDMMREVCLRKAEEENFVQTIDTSTANSKSTFYSRRLVVGRQPAYTFDVDKEVKNRSLRTLLFLESKGVTATSLLFTSHKLMRVLDLSYMCFQWGKVPTSIGKLIHLRYLSLRDARVIQLPFSMRNLKKLLYLNLDISLGGVYIPNIFNEMRELIFLSFPKGLHDETNLELGNLVKLETLKNFNTKHGRVTDLEGKTRLRSLSFNITDKGYTIKTLSSSLREMRCLESLTIYHYKLYTRTNDDDEEGFVWDFVNLKQLWLEKIYMPRLPDAQHFPSQLLTIFLSDCYLEKDPMTILEKLLHLKEISLHFRSFSGKRMVCSRDGFPQLHKLEFIGLEEWEEWIVEEGSMPLLHNLKIGYCPKLKELPDGLRFITSLKSLILFEMANEQKKRLSKGGEDYYKVQHIPSVIFYD